MEVLLPARPTLWQITMNSGQNIKNNYLKVLEMKSRQIMNADGGSTLRKR